MVSKELTVQKDVDNLKLEKMMQSDCEYKFIFTLLDEHSALLNPASYTSITYYGRRSNGEEIQIDCAVEGAKVILIPNDSMTDSAYLIKGYIECKINEDEAIRFPGINFNIMPIAGAGRNPYYNRLTEKDKIEIANIIINECDSFVTTKKIVDGAVTTSKIANSAVTVEKLAGELIKRIDDEFVVDIDIETLAELNDTFSYGNFGETYDDKHIYRITPNSHNLLIKELGYDVGNGFPGRNEAYLFSTLERQMMFLPCVNRILERTYLNYQGTFGDWYEYYLNINDGSVTTGKIATGAVTTEKLGEDVKNQFSELKGDLDELINEDNNLFVKETITEGVYFNYNNAAGTTANEKFCVTDFIECEPNTKYCISNACCSTPNVFMIFYDANKTFIKSSVPYAGNRQLINYIGGGFASTGGVFQTESNTKYFRLSVRMCDIDSIRVYKSDTYKPPLRRIKTDIFEKFGLIDKDNITKKCHISGTNGNLAENDNYVLTDYIPCIGKKFITIGYNAVASNTGMTFYDENYTYISAIKVDTGNVVTYRIPDDAYYLRFTIKGKYVDSCIAVFGRNIVGYSERKDVIDYETVKPVENKVLIPDIVYLAKDVQTDVYYNNLLEMADGSMQGMAYLSNNNLGIGYKRFLRPVVSNASNCNVNFVFADKFGNAYNQKNAKFIVINPTLPQSLNVMCIGDSFTYNGKYMIALKENLEAKGCTLNYIGTITNSAGYQCQGINGKAISMYTAMDSSNPFYNSETGLLDFANFISTKNLTMPDVIIIQFAFNDTKDTEEKDYDYIINNINTVVELYRSANPNGKVIYSLENCPCELDRGRNTVLKKLALMALYKRIMEVFNTADYPYMLVCPSYMFVDRVNGYDLTNITFARGNHTERVPRYDSTHPSNDVGQLQIGDALTGYVMALFN